MEFPHLLRLIEETRVRHHLPRALLVLLAAHRRARLRRARPSPLRRRGAADARRLAADLRARTPRTSRTTKPGASRSSSSASAAAGLDRPRDVLAFPRAGPRGAAGPARVPRGVRGPKGRSVAAYGAAAKGDTLLNYCGIRPDFVDYVVDRSPHKQGRYLPGVRLPIRSPEHVAETKPDYLLILAVEPRGRDRRADELRPRVGRPLRDPAPGGRRP